MENFPILSLIICMPFMSAIFIGSLVKQSMNPAKILYAKYVAILASFLTLVSSISLFFSFELAGGYQFQEHYRLLQIIGLEIELAVDGISIFFILLTSILTVLCIIISLGSINKNIKEFLVALLLLESFVIATFSANNLLLFYICFEATLMPIYIIIGTWGSEDRVYSAFKIFIYTFFGSALFMIDIIYLYKTFSTLSIPLLIQVAPSLSFHEQCFLWILGFLAFGIKVPILPFHTWLPDAHVQAPTAGSVMLAGILLKIGAYGFIRVLVPMFPEASIYFSNFVIYLSSIAVIYGSYVAISQTNIKKMIAYSSIAHMGYVTGGIFSITHEGLSGALFQMISHGIISSGLFLVIGALYERMHTKEIAHFGGLAKTCPLLSVFMMIFTLGAVGVPGTSGFVGELYSLVGIYHRSFLCMTLAASGMILGAIYMLRLYRSVMLGEIHNQEIYKCQDLTFAEIFAIAPLVIAVVLFGVFPGVITMFYDNDVIIMLTKIGYSK
ncbi:MAG: NADH-quinone oxidoreductase subunit M [Rickettsiaceae bacterium]|nr:NADH-quinone oxidoreductase subunit M [Rickettsiaceae bacterium]